jgi:hypothetical protein
MSSPHGKRSAALGATLFLATFGGQMAIAQPESEALYYDMRVYVGSGRTTLLSTSVVLNAGDGVYLYGRATAYSNTNSVVHLSVLRLSCSGPGVSGDYIQSTENHLVNQTRWQAARLLLVAPPSTPSGSVFTCELTAEVRFGAASRYLTYLAGASNTSLTVSSRKAGCGTPGRCARWGTEDDAWERRVRPGTDGQYYQDGVYVGAGNPNGSSEYVLHSRRFEVPREATSLTVYAEPELTTCYEGTGSCPADRSAGRGTGQIGLRLLVQQMCSASSKTVARTTTYPASGELVFSIAEDVHHRKAHLALNNVGFVTSSPTCGAVTGRSFIVKTLVRHLGGPPFKVEMGCDDGRCESSVVQSGTRGYSNSFAFANY